MCARGYALMALLYRSHHQSPPTGSRPPNHGAESLSARNEANCKCRSYLGETPCASVRRCTELSPAAVHVLYCLLGFCPIGLSHQIRDLPLAQAQFFSPINLALGESPHTPTGTVLYCTVVLICRTIRIDLLAEWLSSRRY